MTEDTSNRTCEMTCWGVAALAGIVLAWLLAQVVWLIVALLLGIAAAVILGPVLLRNFCSAGEAREAEHAGLAAAATHPAEGARPVPAPQDEEAAPSVTEYEGLAEPAPATPPAAGLTGQGASQAEARPEAETAEEATTADAGASEAETTPEARADGAAPRRPEGVKAPEGQPDDLKRIKGVGPKLEAMLNAHGIYHFAQIAEWGPEEVAWMDDNLAGFKGRVSRDAWVEQAKVLQTGAQS